MVVKQMNVIDKTSVLNNIDTAIGLIDSKNRKSLVESFVLGSLKNVRDYINTDSLFTIGNIHLHDIVDEYHHMLECLIKMYNVESVYVFCSLALTYVDSLLLKHDIPILRVYESLLKCTIKQLL